jgi:two-component system, chemotaxis family, protein-glutamate methylesterase/glutaminase
MANRIRVLVVDDSTLMRQLLVSVLSEDPEIEVVGEAPDPFVARELIKALNPDVITLDVEMPHMDGVTFLRKLMALRPLPVVMISTLTQAGAHITLEALEVGAVDFIAKPMRNVAQEMVHLSEMIQTKVKNAARAKVGVHRSAPIAAKPRPVRARGLKSRIVFVGASTGGVEAIKALLMQLPEDCPPILITQHMPERFTTSFAERLNKECPMRVSEAQDGDPIEAGHVYIAPGSHHLEIARAAQGYACALGDGPNVSGHRPSVDVLFRSAARVYGRAGVSVILTGMGKDGADGMLEMRKVGAITLGQDERSSLVYGMPKAAFDIGAVAKQYPLNKMGDALLDAAEAPVSIGVARPASVA